LRKNGLIISTNTARNLSKRWQMLGRAPDAKDVEAVTWVVFDRGLTITGIDYVEAIAAIHTAGRKLAMFLTRYDVILSATLPAPPPKLGYFDVNGDVEVFTKRVSEYQTVTPLHNATGTPAVTVPLHWTAEGLPVGVHFAGRYAEEAILLRLVAQLESAQPWFNNVPTCKAHPLLVHCATADPRFGREPTASLRRLLPSLSRSNSTVNPVPAQRVAKTAQRRNIHGHFGLPACLHIKTCV
jgi:Amidase